MTLEQIDYFICAAQSRTFFDAAEAMHISQSSLSKQIMKLEKELELTLWDRSKRTAVLTPEGEFFTKKHLRFPDSIIVLWKQCTILRTVSPGTSYWNTSFSFSVPSYFCDTQFL